MDLPTTEQTPMAGTKAPIERLPTDVWWQLAKLISLKDLSNLRLVSRGVEHEIHQPYIDRRFHHITINALHPRAKHPIMEREPDKVCAAVRALTISHHFQFYFPGSGDGPIPKTCQDEAYAPLRSLGSFTNLKSLVIWGIFPEWLDNHFSVSDLRTVLATNSIKIRELELNEVDSMPVEDLKSLIMAFGDSVKKLSLYCARKTQWLEMFQMLRTLRLLNLKIEFEEGMENHASRPGHARLYEPSFPRCKKWVGRRRREERLVMRHRSLEATGRMAVEAGLKKAIRWWEAEYPKP
ncbi:hypothetical protein LTR17_016699 [Elasticomyces elasticus]|nr:hypothetical protein LTR17_016699 [Elasticomyces elasticus]